MSKKPLSDYYYVTQLRDSLDTIVRYLSTGYGDSSNILHITAEMKSTLEFYEEKLKKDAQV